jgi:hypothetical protein
MDQQRQPAAANRVSSLIIIRAILAAIDFAPFTDE